jgi:hypothetical protein
MSFTEVTAVDLALRNLRGEVCVYGGGENVMVCEGYEEKTWHEMSVKNIGLTYS